MKKVIFLPLLVLLLGACWAIFNSAPARFAQFEEYAITGSGSYQIPQWSPDSRYLAYINTSNVPSLVVYDTQTGTSETAGTNVSTSHFSWKSDGSLTYLRYRPDLSGTPYPRISELHQIDLSGNDDEVIAENLSSAGDFAWFSDGERAAILLTDPASNHYYNDVYLLNIAAETLSMLVKAQDVGFQYIVSITLAPDENSLLIYGANENADPRTELVLYNLETESITERIIPSQLISSGGIEYPGPGILDSTNASWVGSDRWFLAPVNTPGGDCYNYALFFFNLADQLNSFCIPTKEGIVAFPVISPNLTNISYVTVVGPGHAYVMIGTVPPDLLDRLAFDTNDVDAAG